MAKINTQAQAKVPAAPMPTLTPDALAALLAQVTAERDALLAKAGKGKADIEDATVKAFRRGGYGEVKPRQDVRTYNLWLEAGRKVKEGERSTKVRSLRLFHISQTDPISAGEQAKLLAEKAAKKAARDGGTVRPSEAIAAKGKAKPAPVQPAV